MFYFNRYFFNINNRIFEIKNSIERLNFNSMEKIYKFFKVIKTKSILMMSYLCSKDVSRG
jgi:hypothetical protein